MLHSLLVPDHVGRRASGSCLCLLFSLIYFRFVVVICTARTASFFLWRPVAALLFFSCASVVYFVRSGLFLPVYFSLSSLFFVTHIIFLHVLLYGLFIRPYLLRWVRLPGQ